MASEYFTAGLVLLDGEFEIGAYIGMEDGRIVSASTELPPARATIHDFGQSAAIFPGTVNTHTHSYLALLRGSVDGLPLTDWLREIYAAMADYDEEAAYLGAALSFGEMLLSGNTTAADFFYLNGRGNENILAAIRASKDVGIRLVMGRTFLDAEWGGPATRETAKTGEARFRELWEAFRDDPQVEISPAPHSLYGSSRELIEAAYALATEYDTLWYLHVADSEASAQRVKEMFGAPTIEVLQSWGVLDDRLVSVHGLWLTEEETRLLAEHAGRLSYNPASNMFFGERILDVPALWRRGIRVGLATDGAASNNSLNLFSDVRVASLAQKVRARDPAAVTADQLVALATSEGGRVLGLPVGALAPGQRCDFVVIDTRDFSLQPIRGLKSNIVHAMSDRAIKHVYCEGRQVVRDGQLVLIDEDEITERIASFANRRS